MSDYNRYKSRRECEVCGYAFIVKAYATVDGKDRCKQCDKEGRAKNANP